MAIIDSVTGTVKDVFVLSKNIVKVVKEEVVGFNGGNDDDYDYEEESSVDTSSMFKYIETFETKAKEVIGNAFSGFTTSKSEEQEELEERIAALEAKLSKLVEESLEALRKD
jgi:phosphate uptake regulator